MVEVRRVEEGNEDVDVQKMGHGPEVRSGESFLVPKPIYHLQGDDALIGGRLQQWNPVSDCTPLGLSLERRPGELGEDLSGSASTQCCQLLHSHEDVRVKV